MTIVAILVTIVILAIGYSIFNSVHESRMNKIWKEVGELVHEKFNEEMKYLVELVKTQETAILKIKAIFDHLGIKNEIEGVNLPPSIDTFRSLSFVKEYLPEIDEQLRIYKDAENEIDRLDTTRKSRYVISQLVEQLSNSKWRKNRWTSASIQQKREIIHKLYEEYVTQRNQNEDQENLTE